MARIALVCPAFYSHLRAFEAIGEALRQFGHDLVFLLPSGAGSMVQLPGTIVAEVPPARGYDPEKVIRRAARPRGVLGILRTVRDSAATTDLLCRHGPDILRSHGIDAVIGDELEPAGGLIARRLGVPLVSLAAALPIERDPLMPLPFLDWPYDTTERGLARNRGGELVGGLLLTRQRRTIRRWSRAFGFPEIRSDVDCLSQELRLSQTVAAFDFPRPHDTLLRPVGPIRSATLAQNHRRAPKGDGRRPLVFASLGTLQGHRIELFRMIAGACRDLGAQIVVAHCGGLDRRQAARLDADHVVDFVHQREILERADACVTHGGLNTVLDALAAGTPMLALPIAFDQPGVGARIDHHRVGETLSAGRATRAGIRDRLAQLIDHREDYVRAAEPLRLEIARSDGARHGAAIVHELLTGRDPEGSVGKAHSLASVITTQGSFVGQGTR